jgi:hypothetical protein
LGKAPRFLQQFQHVYFGGHARIGILAASHMPWQRCEKSWIQAYYWAENLPYVGKSKQFRLGTRERFCLAQRAA